MTPEEFRQHGHEVVDWIADYWGRIGEFPVRSQVSPGDVRAALPPSPPEQGEPFAAIMADLDRVVLPGTTHWQHPGFFGYFPANTSGPSVLGDLLSAGLGVQGMSWVTSPAATEVEQHVMDWLAELLDLPASFRSTGTGGGVVQDSSSGANLIALLAALHRVSRGATLRQGVRPDEYTVYVSAQTHSSMEKAARIAGLGTDAIRVVEVDAELAMSPRALAARIERDVARGFVPVLVCATVGTTSTTAIDPLAELGPICQRYGVWLHVDAAYAGVAAVAPELRPLQAGVEWADSYTTDAHKWLLTGFDATLFWVADRAALTGALAILPEYLRNAATDAGAVVDYRDWQIELGRRFRALKLWFVVRWYGAEGLRAHVREHVALAQELAGWAEADERFDVAAPHPLSLVCLRPCWARGVDADVATMTLLERLNDGGEVFLTHTTVDGAAVLRVAIGAPATTRGHVERLWTLLREGHDWLANDFEEQAREQREAEAARRAQEEQAHAERELAARQAEAAAAAPAEGEVPAADAAAGESGVGVQDGVPAELDTPGEEHAPVAVEQPALSGTPVHAEVALQDQTPAETPVETPAAWDESAAQAAAQPPAGGTDADQPEGRPQD
ncbi:aspartate aminotransferase family protein [Modestobacter muralis]|uniref:Aspartate aminotransferase family protein n=2 Tax=Modestobacter muralis TaxID=1608614 RepID=A0A6P0EQD8_9ACTN|nr:pyridoxal-dependent decarboxylase [Modestobacter muralis]NEK93941.1 aspartate aminotransferase family protein [Modestobacter muralis]NEN50708.1 aspartate aminotransferase family protein [Modestobacter muralis]